MNIIWGDSVAFATKMNGNFTLDVSGRIYTETDGNWIISVNGKQFVATDEEIEAEQQRFAMMYECAYEDMGELDTEESDEYIASFKK